MAKKSIIKQEYSGRKKGIWTNYKWEFRKIRRRRLNGKIVVICEKRIES